MRVVCCCCCVGVGGGGGAKRAINGSKSSLSSSSSRASHRAEQNFCARQFWLSRSVGASLLPSALPLPPPPPNTQHSEPPRRTCSGALRGRARARTALGAAAVRWPESAGRVSPRALPAPASQQANALAGSDGALPAASSPRARAFAADAPARGPHFLRGPSELAPSVLRFNLCGAASARRPSPQRATGAAWPTVNMLPGGGGATPRLT